MGVTRVNSAEIAEDEDGLPPDWQPLSVERGFPKGSNVVTVSTVMGAFNLSGGGTANTKEEGLKNLYKIAAAMRNPMTNYFSENWRKGSPGTVLLPRDGARGLSALGWSKEDVKAFLWKNSKVPWSEIKRSLSPVSIEYHSNLTGLKKNEPWPITSQPGNIIVAVAGGEQSGHCYWMQGASMSPETANAEIELPAKWEELLKKAEEDLGPAPSR